MRKFVNGLVLALLLSPLAAIAADLWVYRYPLDQSSGFSISEEKIQIGSLEMSVKFCGKADPYICFESEGVNFSVPRNLSTKEATSWSHGGHRYEAIYIKSPLRIIGKQLMIYQIDSPSQNPAMRFLFSKEKGLIGAKVLSRDEKALLLVEQACGFGASHTCSAR